MINLKGCEFSMIITVCDDDPAIHPLLTGYIQDYFHQNKPELANSLIINNYQSGEIFLKNPHADILFLDIYMGSLSGIDMLKRLPAKYHPRFLIFITTSREFAVEAFEMNASHYLLKPFTSDNVFNALDRCHIRDTFSPVMTLHAASGLITIPLSSIRYIEAFNKRTLIHTISDTFSTYDALSSLSEQLDDRFMQPHRSFIVSMSHISAFYYDHLIMDDDLKISLSRKKRTELKGQYHQYLAKITRRELS